MLRLPIDYEGILCDRVLIITGVGRSGTTILGKLIGSMKLTVYLFEPAILKFIAAIRGFPGTQRVFAQAFYGALVEDYFIPRLVGRRTDLDSDDSWIGHYWKPEATISRHSEALTFLVENKPLLVIKSLEIATCLTAAPIFPGQRVIHIVRNGIDVVSSAVERGWYTDEWCTQQIDWVEDSGAPWWMDVQAARAWREWTPLTRAAACWSKLLNDADAIPGAWRIRYEDLCGNPRHYVGLFEERFGLKRTATTENHIKGVKWRQRSRLNLEDIQMPERERFREKMEQLRYL